MKKIVHTLKVLVLLATLGACTEDYFIESAPASGKVNMTTYDYLAAHPDTFGDLTSIIDKTGLKTTVNQDGITFFAPQNESIQTYLGSKGLSSIDQVDTQELDSLLSKYMFDEKKLRANFNTGLGDDFTTFGNVEMNVKIVIGSYKGVQGVGAKNIIYTDIALFQSLKDDKQSTSPAEVLVTTGDIETTNAAIHILDPSHKFGF